MIFSWGHSNKSDGEQSPPDFLILKRAAPVTEQPQFLN